MMMRAKRKVWVMAVALVHYAPRRSSWSAHFLTTTISLTRFEHILSPAANE